MDITWICVSINSGVNKKINLWKIVTGIVGAKIKLTKRKNGHYLPVKSNAGDRNYLDGFRKHEPPIL